MGLRGKGSTPQVLRRPVRLSHAQEQSLLYGDLPGRGAFGSEGEFRAAWELHRGRLLGETAPGRRPMGWWLADAGNLQFPGRDLERSTLHQAGLLDAAERAELEVYWRREFEKAQQDGFTVCLSAGHWLAGEEARREHLAWADVPAALVQEWTRETRSNATPKSVQRSANPAEPSAEPHPVVAAGAARQLTSDSGAESPPEPPGAA